MSADIQAGDSLARVAKMAHLMMSIGQTIAEQEATLAKTKAAFTQIEQEDLPELMRELTLTEIKLDDGTAIEVKDDVQCGITEANRPAAHAWLDKNGFGGLIKTVIVIAFTRDERKAAEAAAVKIQKTLKREVLVNESVHAATLKSFVKEQLAQSKEVPTTTFSVHPFVRAKITPPSASAKPKAALKGKKSKAA